MGVRSIARLPPTSVLRSAIARVYLYTHPEAWKEVGFEALAPVPDAWTPTIIQRHQCRRRPRSAEGYEPLQAAAAWRRVLQRAGSGAAQPVRGQR